MKRFGMRLSFFALLVWIIACAVVSGICAFQIHRIYRMIEDSDMDGSLHVSGIQTRNGETGRYMEHEVYIEGIMGMSLNSYRIYGLGNRGTLVVWHPVMPHKATIAAEGFCPRVITIGRNTQEDYDVILNPCPGEMCRNEDCMEYRRRKKSLSNHQGLLRLDDDGSK